jgi:hypothetical protein
MNTVKQMLHLEMILYLKSAHILAISGGLHARWTSLVYGNMSFMINIGTLTAMILEHYLLHQLFFHEKVKKELTITTCLKSLELQQSKFNMTLHLSDICRRKWHL